MKDVLKILLILPPIFFSIKKSSCNIHYNDNVYFNIFLRVHFLKTIVNKIPQICWIFNKNNLYQALISFGSIIRSNVGQKFIFYFIIPPNNEINITDFNHLLKYGSEIKVIHYDKKFAYLPKFSRRRCPTTGIILVKLFLKDILTDVDEVLYLDTDVISTSSIVNLWDVNLTGKTMAATHRIHIPQVWINSGVILYNLNELRKRNSSLWKCADMANCVVDDAWHTWCHQKEWVEVLPYRYNVEFLAMSKKYNQSKYQINEEENACLFHIKDDFHKFYKVKNTNEMNDIKLVRENPKVMKHLDNLFDIKNWVEAQIRDTKRSN